MNPFDWRGPQFLLFYFLLSVAVVTRVIVWRRRDEAGPVPQFSAVDPYLIAFLRGDVGETIRVAVLSLLDRGLLAAEGTRVIATPLAETTRVNRRLERAILESCAASVQVATLYSADPVTRSAEVFKQELRRLRLMPDDRQRSRRLWVGLLSTGLLGGIALVKILVALSRGRHNVLFLVVMMGFSTVFVLAALVGRRTTLGERVITDLQQLFEGLRTRSIDLPTGGATNELALLLGVFGMSALAGDAQQRASTLFPLAAAQLGSNSHMYAGTSCGANTSSSCGSSSCGGGGCGGGCGGCGS
jgi:uncharacterized protein (TIGR04222 family)